MDWNIEIVAGPYKGGTDGPVWDGEALLFAVPAESLILRYHPGTARVSEYRKYTGNTCALAFGPDGELFGCQASARRVVRFNFDGTMSMLADRLEGRLHNQPDDLVLDRRGRVWFTDPLPHPRVLEPPVDHASVLRLQKNAGGAWYIERMTLDTVFPTGIMLSVDEQILFVSDSDDKAGTAELRAYPIQADGTLGRFRVLKAFAAGSGVRGMCLDINGNLIACLGGSDSDHPPEVTVFSPTGTVLESHRFQHGQPNNCAFGGFDLTTLYITTAEGLLCCAQDSGRRENSLDVAS